MGLEVPNRCASYCVHLQSQSMKRLQSYTQEPKNMAATDDVAKDCRAKQLLGSKYTARKTRIRICRMRILLCTSIGLSDTRKPWRANGTGAHLDVAF